MHPPFPACSFTTNPLKPAIQPPSGWTYAYVHLDRYLAVEGLGKVIFGV